MFPLDHHQGARRSYPKVTADHLLVCYTVVLRQHACNHGIILSKNHHIFVEIHVVKFMGNIGFHELNYLNFNEYMTIFTYYDSMITGMLPQNHIVTY